MKKLVYIVGGDKLVEKMFTLRNWLAVSEPVADPDLVVFTGGEDVSPEIYGEENKGSYGCDIDRDNFEVGIYQSYKDVPKAGICRGGQLLNVLSGGKMIQHIGKLRTGDVSSHNHVTGKDVTVRVDHHQGISPDYDKGTLFMEPSDTLYVDAFFYPETKSFCFQPHPEWNHKPTEELFFRLMNSCFEFDGGQLEKAA